MPKDHRDYLEWNGDRFRNWAKSIGEHTYKAIDAMLTSRVVEQQAYKGCMALLKLEDKYPKVQIEEACKRALSYTSSPSYKSIQNILVRVASETKDEVKPARNPYGITRGANYYNGGGQHV